MIVNWVPKVVTFQELGISSSNIMTKGFTSRIRITKRDKYRITTCQVETFFAINGFYSLI